MIPISSHYGLVISGRVVAKGSKQAMRKLQREGIRNGSHRNTGAFIVCTTKEVGEEWQPKPTGFESLPVRS